MYKCVDYADGETRERLVAKITANALLLSKHPYGFVHLHPPIFLFSLHLEYYEPELLFFGQLAGN